ncbi:MAG: hypothetical protein HC901_00200 [Bdellovibrionaceae bacterium]|nr:hypothetical protein [Pseudobdellovibrionaceae bacterium]
MKIRLLSLLLLFGLLAWVPVQAGSDMVDDVALSQADSDCEEKLAAANASIAELQTKLLDLEKELALLKAAAPGTDVSVLERRMKELEALNLQLQAKADTKPSPAELETKEDASGFNWLPWLIALVLAVVGFFLGRNSAEKKNS